MSSIVNELEICRAEIGRLRAFIKSIDDAWIENEAADEDEWNDGYEDCLAEWAKKARQTLKESFS